MTATIEYADMDELERKLTAALESLGCLVVDNPKWERPKAVRVSLGVNAPIFHKRLGNYPGQFPKIMGAKRIRFMQTTPPLLAHLKGQPYQPPTAQDMSTLEHLRAIRNSL